MTPPACSGQTPACSAFRNPHVSALRVSAFLGFGSFCVTQGQGIFVSPMGASLQPKMSDGFLPGSLVSDTAVQTVFTLSPLPLGITGYDWSQLYCLIH